MKVALEPNPVLNTPSRMRTAPALDVRHLLIGPCGTHSLKANGVYQVARALADEQVAAGERARLILLREENSIIPDETSDTELEVVPIEGPKLLGRRVGLSRKVLQALIKDADQNTVVHIHTARQPLLIPLARELGKRKIPYVITVHGRYSHLFDERGKIKRKVPAWYLKSAERWVLNRARFVQAVSPLEKTQIQAIAPDANIELVPNAAFSSRMGMPSGDNIQRLPSNGPPVFGFLGRYEIEHKGLDLLLEGFAGYRRAGGKGTLVMVGSGPMREVLAMRAVELSLRECSTIEGPKFGAAKTDAIKSWDYFVSPSRFDGLPMATLEAALLGVPVIVTQATGLGQTVNDSHAGIVIEHLDAAAVTRALQKAEATSAKAWTEMSSAATKMARTIGDWTSISRRIVDLYRRK